MGVRSGREACRVRSARSRRRIVGGCSRRYVCVIRAADRAIVAGIDVGDQAHAAMASPDDRWILKRE